MKASSLGKEVSIKKSVLGAMCAAGMSLALFFGMAAMPSQAYADETDGTSQEFTVTVEGYGEKTLDVKDAEAAGILNTAPAACLYKATTKNELSQTGYVWKVIAYKDYVTIDDLLGYMTGNDDLTVDNIASMKFDALEETSPGVYESLPYTKYTFNASTLAGQDLFFNNMSPQGSFNASVNSPSPIALAFSWHEARDLTSIADAAYLNIKNDYEGYTDDVRFFMGLDAQTAKAPDGDGVNMGRRLPYGVTAVDITLN